MQKVERRNNNAEESLFVSAAGRERGNPGASKRKTQKIKTGKEI